MLALLKPLVSSEIIELISLVSPTGEITVLVSNGWGVCVCVCFMCEMRNTKALQDLRTFVGIMHDPACDPNQPN